MKIMKISLAVLALINISDAKKLRRLDTTLMKFVDEKDENILDNDNDDIVKTLGAKKEFIS